MTAGTPPFNREEMINPDDLAELAATVIALPNTTAVAELLANCRLEDTLWPERPGPRRDGDDGILHPGAGWTVASDDDQVPRRLRQRLAARVRDQHDIDDAHADFVLEAEERGLDRDDHARLEGVAASAVDDQRLDP